MNERERADREMGPAIKERLKKERKEKRGGGRAKTTGPSNSSQSTEKKKGCGNRDPGEKIALVTLDREGKRKTHLSKSIPCSNLLGARQNRVQGSRTDPTEDSPLREGYGFRSHRQRNVGKRHIGQTLISSGEQETPS